MLGSSSKILGGSGKASSEPFIVHIDKPPNPPPAPPEKSQRPPHRRAAHAVRLMIGKQVQFAPEFGPRGVGGNLALRTVRGGKPPLRGEWWSTPRFEAVVNAYKENFLHGRIRDGRSQLCMYHKGQKVVDAFGDALGEDADYDGSSLQAIFSCSKLATAIVFAWLRDRGHVDYDALVTKYWPEFGQGGKHDVTVQDMLTHDAGIPWCSEKVPGELTVGTERLNELADLLAKQERLYPRGTRVYHAVIQGPLLNELCRRADPKRRMVAEVMTQEIAGPLGIDIFYSLTKEQADARLVNSYVPSDLWTDWNIKMAYGTTGCFLGSDQPGLKSVLETQADMNSVYNLASRPVQADHSASEETQRNIFINTPCMCASNGMANARSLAKLGAMLVNGGEVDGVRILKQSTVREMCSGLDLRSDAFFGDADMGWTKGGIYRWDHSAEVYAIREGAIGWAGLGGSCLILDMEKGLSTSFVTASMRHPATTELRWAPFFQAAYAVIEAGEHTSKWKATAAIARAFVRKGPQHDKRLVARAVNIM